MSNLQELVIKNIRRHADEFRAEISGIEQRYSFKCRVQALSPEELAEFESIESGEISDELIQAFNACSNETDRQKLIDSYINIQIFKLRAWYQYLNGHSMNKPFSS